MFCAWFALYLAVLVSSDRQKIDCSLEKRSCQISSAVGIEPFECEPAEFSCGRQGLISAQIIFAGFGCDRDEYLHAFRHALKPQEWISIVNRGTCPFEVKAKLAYDFKALGIIIIDNQEQEIKGKPTVMGSSARLPIKNFSAVAAHHGIRRSIKYLIDSSSFGETNFNRSDCSYVVHFNVSGGDSQSVDTRVVDLTQFVETFDSKDMQLIESNKEINICNNASRSPIDYPMQYQNALDSCMKLAVDFHSQPETRAEALLVYKLILILQRNQFNFLQSPIVHKQQCPGFLPVVLNNIATLVSTRGLIPLAQALLLYAANRTCIADILASADRGDMSEEAALQFQYKNPYESILYSSIQSSLASEQQNIRHQTVIENESRYRTSVDDGVDTRLRDSLCSSVARINLLTLLLDPDMRGDLRSCLIQDVNSRRQRPKRPERPTRHVHSTHPDDDDLTEGVFAAASSTTRTSFSKETDNSESREAKATHTAASLMQWRVEAEDVADVLALVDSLASSFSSVWFSNDEQICWTKSQSNALPDTHNSIPQRFSDLRWCLLSTAVHAAVALPMLASAIVADAALLREWQRSARKEGTGGGRKEEGKGSADAAPSESVYKPTIDERDRNGVADGISSRLARTMTRLLDFLAGAANWRHIEEYQRVLSCLLLTGEFNLSCSSPSIRRPEYTDGSDESESDRSSNRMPLHTAKMSISASLCGELLPGQMTEVLRVWQSGSEPPDQQLLFPRARTLLRMDSKGSKWEEQLLVGRFTARLPHSQHLGHLRKEMKSVINITQGDEPGLVEANHAACSLRTEEILLQASSHIADLASPSLPPVGDLDAAISSAAGPLRIAFISPNFRMSHPAGQQLSHLLRALQPWVYLQPANCHKLVNRTEDEDVMEVKEEGQKVGRGQEEEEEKCSPSMPRVVVYCFSYGTSGDQGGDGGKGGGDEEVDKPTSESLDLWTDPVCAGGLRHVTYVTPSQSLQASAQEREQSEASLQLFEELLVDLVVDVAGFTSAAGTYRLLAAAKARRQNIIEKYMQSHDQINEQINAQNKEPEIPNARSLPAHNQRSPHPLVVAHLSDRVNPFAGGVGLGAAGIVDFIIGDPVSSPADAWVARDALRKGARIWSSSPSQSPSMSVLVPQEFWLGPPVVVYLDSKDNREEQAEEEVGVVKEEEEREEIRVIEEGEEQEEKEVADALTSGGSFDDLPKHQYTSIEGILAETSREQPINAAPDSAAGGDVSPSDSIVFVNSGRVEKIDPTTFRIWCAILRRIPRSELWLFVPGPGSETITNPAHNTTAPSSPSPSTQQGLRQEVRQELQQRLLFGAEAIANMATTNLRIEAAAAGVAPKRIKFLQRAAHDDHLRRLAAHTHIALDSRSFNGLTTAADIVRAGVPLVTMQGSGASSSVSSTLFQQDAGKRGGKRGGEGEESGQGGVVGDLIAGSSYHSRTASTMAGQSAVWSPFSGKSTHSSRGSDSQSNRSSRQEVSDGADVDSMAMQIVYSCKEMEEVAVRFANIVLLQLAHHHHQQQQQQQQQRQRQGRRVMSESSVLQPPDATEAAIIPLLQKLLWWQTYAHTLAHDSRTTAITIERELTLTTGEHRRQDAAQEVWRRGIDTVSATLLRSFEGMTEVRRRTAVAAAAVINIPERQAASVMMAVEVEEEQQEEEVEEVEYYDSAPLSPNGRNHFRHHSTTHKLKLSSEPAQERWHLVVVG